MLAGIVRVEGVLGLEHFDVNCSALLSGNLSAAAVYWYTVDQKPDPLTKLVYDALTEWRPVCAGFPDSAAIKVSVELVRNPLFVRLPVPPADRQTLPIPPRLVNLDRLLTRRIMASANFSQAHEPHLITPVRPSP